MNLDLKSDKLSFIKPVFRRRLTREETAEVIVPDALPDILRILDTHGEAYLRSKDSDAGSVTVTGVMELTVLYVPESGTGVKKLSASLPFSVSADGADITADCMIVAGTALIGADARTVNPRKIVIRGEVECDTALYLTDSVYNTSPREQEGVYFKSETVRRRVPSAVNEKSFVFTDEARMPAGSEPMGEILRYNTVLECESVKPVGSRAVVKGSAHTVILYEARDAGGLCRASFDTPFSQIVETDAVGEAADFDMTLTLTGAYVQRGGTDDSGSETVSIEIHAVAQCVSFSDASVEMVTDAYSTKHTLSSNVAQCAITCLDGRETASETLSVSVPISEGCQSVKAVTAHFTGLHMMQGEDGMKLGATAAVTVIYEDSGGQLLSASRRGELSREFEQGSWNVWTQVKVSGEPFTSVGDGTIDVRIPAEIYMTRQNEITLSRIESVDIDEDSTADLTSRPSVVLTRAGGGRGLWELAKAHMSTVELICQTNGIEPGAEPEPGQVLLIPRCG